MNETFRTTLKIKESPIKITYTSKSLFIGSCFTENIGSQLKKLKFTVDVNPFGPCYNPISVKNCIELLIIDKIFSENDLHFFNNLWFSYSHHSSFSERSKEGCLKKINDRLGPSSQFLKSTDFLFITFGTSWIFELIETGEVVSNCHKIPAEKFNRRMVSADEITSLYKPLISNLFAINPNLKIIFTVSPIRHLKDEAEGNMLSKATLIVAIHRLKELFPAINYFPAFEIFMDDLRDYRFYAEDLVHPSETAIKYIREIFFEAYVSKKAIEISKELEKILQLLNHRPFDVKGAVHQNFIKETLKKVEVLETKYNFLKFTDEKEFFKNQLI